MATGITKKKAKEVSEQFDNIAVSLEQIIEGLSSEVGRQKFLESWGGVEPINALKAIQKLAKHNGIVVNILYPAK